MGNKSECTCSVSKVNVVYLELNLNDCVQGWGLKRGWSGQQNLFLHSGTFNHVFQDPMCCSNVCGRKVQLTIKDDQGKFCLLEINVLMSAGQDRIHLKLVQLISFLYEKRTIAVNTKKILHIIKKMTWDYYCSVWTKTVIIMISEKCNCNVSVSFTIFVLLFGFRKRYFKIKRYLSLIYVRK